MAHTYAFLLGAAYILPIWSSPVDSVALAPTAKLRRDARQDELDVLTKEFRVSIGTRPMMNVPRIDLPSWKKPLGWHRNTWKMYCCLRPTIPTVKVLQILLLGTCSSSNLAKPPKTTGRAHTRTDSIRSGIIWNKLQVFHTRDIKTDRRDQPKSGDLRTITMVLGQMSTNAMMNRTCTLFPKHINPWLMWDTAAYTEKPDLTGTGWAVTLCSQFF